MGLHTIIVILFKVLNAVLQKVLFFLSRLWSELITLRGKGLCGTNDNLWYKDTPCQYQEMMQ